MLNPKILLILSGRFSFFCNCANSKMQVYHAQMRLREVYTNTENIIKVSRGKQRFDRPIYLLRRNKIMINVRYIHTGMYNNIVHTCLPKTQLYQKK